MNRIDKSPNVLHTGHNIEVRQTSVFREWLGGLKDRQARLRIDSRLLRLKRGNVGDSKPVGEGVQELRLPFGPGYRIYYVWRGPIVILLLSGGDKSSQKRDIAAAKQMAKEAINGVENLSF